jgi:hypothetical protein
MIAVSAYLTTPNLRRNSPIDNTCLPIQSSAKHLLILFLGTKKAEMEYVLGYPKSGESWYQMLFEWIETWWMKRALRKFEENDLLID